MESVQDNFKQLPNNRDHNCFGCSPVNSSGLQMTFYTNESAVYSNTTVPNHLCGWNNLVHGGVLTTIMDEIMSWAAIYLLKQVPMTKSITVDFLFSPAVAKRLSITDSESLKWFERIFNLK
jgi:acyl-coenzyme A thioesterase PaaI-like protein